MSRAPQPQDRPRRTLGGSDEVDRFPLNGDAVRVRVGPLVEETPETTDYDVNCEN